MTKTGLDVDLARRDTPGCDNVVHLNNAGAALPPECVTEAMVAHLRLESEMGGYEAADHASRHVQNTYTAIARLIGCDVGEVAVVENATRAWDQAFYAMRFEDGDTILTSRAEYASNVIAFLQVTARTGARIVVVDDDEHGQISVRDLRRRINRSVKLIALTHVPTQGGLVNPAIEVGNVAKDAGITYLLDACQSVGQLPVDVQAIGCDILSATGRKYLRGPRGTGFLYVRDTLLPRLEPPFLDLHAAAWTSPAHYVVRPDARRFENWETNYAAKIGLGVAIDYALTWGLDAIEERVTMLAEHLRDGLIRIPGVSVHDQGIRKCGIVTFTVDGTSAQAVQEALSGAGINTSVSLVEYAQLDLPTRGLAGLVRASVHYYNTEAEIQRLLEVVADIP
ncbi:MAG: aminotransferase class V-fold PLP-dependent enzyme [Actinomycetes bacterium]